MRSNSSRLRVLPRLAMGFLACGLLLLSAVFMHTLMTTMSGSSSMRVSSTMSLPLTDRIETAPALQSPMVEAVAATPLVQPLTDQDGDCSGLCGAMCSLMGVACVMLLVVLTVVLLRGSGRRLLFMGSMLLSAGPSIARGVVPRRPMSLSALSILRV